MLLVLGASAWPLAPKLPSSPVFEQSAADIVAYFTDPKLFGLPSDDGHVLNLFNRNGAPNAINGTLSRWLQDKQERAANAGRPMRDLIVYYVGHGGFTPVEQAYFLALPQLKKATKAFLA